MWPNPQFPADLVTFNEETLLKISFFVQSMLFFKETLEIYLVFRSQLQMIIKTYNLPLLDVVNSLYHECLKNKRKYFYAYLHDI